MYLLYCCNSFNFFCKKEIILSLSLATRGYGNSLPGPLTKTGTPSELRTCSLLYHNCFSSLATSTVSKPKLIRKRSQSLGFFPNIICLSQSCISKTRKSNNCSSKWFRYIIPSKLNDILPM